MKLEILREIIKMKNDTPIDIINTYLYKKKPNSFSNAYIAYRIMRTIHINIVLPFENKI